MSVALDMNNRGVNGQEALSRSVLQDGCSFLTFCQLAAAACCL